MILTCPECATSYFVDDARVPAAGRLVKCTSCGARWTAVKDAPVESTPAPAPAPKPAPPRVPEPFVPAAQDDLEVVPIVPAGKSKAKTKAAARAARTASGKEARGKVVILALAGVAVVALVGGAIVFRDEVVHLLPASQAAYAGIGLPVNTLGLVIENVRAEPVFQGGRPVLAVSGVIRSIREEAAIAPSIRISLLDRAGKSVAEKISTPLDARIPGRSTRHFAIAILDPPSTVHDLQVTFEAPSGAASHIGKPAHAVVPSAAPHDDVPIDPAPTAEAPVDAEPLPPGSLDALPPHD